MAFIDRRVSIRDETLSTPLTLAAMVAYATGCPECESFGVEDLGDTDSLRFFGSLGRKKGGRVETVVRITLTEAEHAQMSMIAASEFRSPSNLGKAWIRQRLASLRESASQTGDPA